MHFLRVAQGKIPHCEQFFSRCQFPVSHLATILDFLQLTVLKMYGIADQSNCMNLVNVWCCHFFAYLFQFIVRNTKLVCAWTRALVICQSDLQVKCKSQFEEHVRSLAFPCLYYEQPTTFNSDNFFCKTRS